jgi:SAM-dependent methyltransferase
MSAIRPGMSVEEFSTAYDAGELNLDRVAEFSVVCPQWLDISVDPRSSEYAAQVMKMWSAITGRSPYDASVDEAFPLDPQQFLGKPYPYSSDDTGEIGRYFGAMAWLFRELDGELPERIVEMGAGWGHLALMLAMTGRDVVAVDLNAPSVELLRRRAEALSAPLRVVHSSFLDYTDQDVDMIVFFESLHHCSQPLELLDHCRSLLRSGGSIVMLAEAIADDFYCPWGVRLDGQAAYMSRHAGWMELGFDRSFFYREMNARGFAMEHRLSPELGSYGTLDIARHIPDGNTLAGALAPVEERTWDYRRPDSLPGRIAGTASECTLCEDPARTVVEVTLVNLCDQPLAVSLNAGAVVGGGAVSSVVDAGATVVVSAGLSAGPRSLRVTSERAWSPSLGLDHIGLLVQSLHLR